MVKIYSAYSDDKIRVGFESALPSKTKQSFKEESDINVIMRRYAATGVLDYVAGNPGQFGDVTGMEFQSMQEIIAGARSQFEDLPSVVRSRFKNDPQEFLTFMENAENRKEMESLGMFKEGAFAAREAAVAAAAAAAAAPVVSPSETVVAAVVPPV